MVRNVRPGDLVLALGCLGLGIVLPVALDLDPVQTTAVFAAGMASGAATGPLTGGRKFAAFFALLAVGVVVLGSLVRTDSGGSWIAGMVLGAVLGVALTDRADRGRSRLRASATRKAEAPTSTESLRARWDDGAQTVRPDAPSTVDVLDAVRALDGRGRTVVSIGRGPARLDVGGDAAGCLLVLLCEDVGARLPRWQALAGGPEKASGAEVTLRIAGTDGHVPGADTTTLGPALEAVEHFAATGAPAPAHEWRGGVRVGDLRPPALETPDEP